MFICFAAGGSTLSLRAVCSREPALGEEEGQRESSPEKGNSMCEQQPKLEEGEILVKST